MDPYGTETVTEDEIHDAKPSEDVEDDDDKSQPHSGGGVDSAGKIFVGGLARETTSAEFVKHFGKYGEITDSVIMKDRKTGQPRGFGFVTYADSSVVDKVIQDNHIIIGKQSTWSFILVGTDVKLRGSPSRRFDLDGQSKSILI